MIHSLIFLNEPYQPHNFPTMSNQGTIVQVIGAVVDVEKLDGPVTPAGERVLVVGQRHEGAHVVSVQLEGVLEAAIEEPNERGRRRRR